MSNTFGPMACGRSVRKRFETPASNFALICYKVRVSPEQFKRVYPYLTAWIETTLRNQTQYTYSVASARFARLPLYFLSVFLQRAKYVSASLIPIPPLTAMGLDQFAEFEQLNAEGITYLDTYFLREESIRSERLHFHELIHVAQWQALGPANFLRVYAEGLGRFGYRQSPLEVMAYEAERDFVCGVSFDAELRVRVELDRLTA